MPDGLGPKYLPGDLRPADDIDRMIRVDHAGEFGAVRIYAGQMDVLESRPTAPVIREMATQEQRHLDRFNALSQKKIESYGSAKRALLQRQLWVLFDATIPQSDSRPTTLMANRRASA